MTIKMTDNIQSATEADPQIKAVFATNPDLAALLAVSTPPGPAVPFPASAPPDLESRIVARRAELIAKLVALKHDTRLEAAETRDRLKAKLSEVAHIIKDGVVDGWANLGDAAKHKLEHWLTS